MCLTGSFTTAPRSLDVPSSRSASSSLQLHHPYRFNQTINELIIFLHILKRLYTIASNHFTSSCCNSNFPPSTAVGREISWGISLPARKILLRLHTHLWEIINDAMVLLIRWGHSPSHFFKNVAKVTTLPTITCIISKCFVLLGYHMAGNVCGCYFSCYPVCMCKG